MKRKLKFNRSILILIILTTFYLLFFYHKVLLSPNSYLIVDGGDGIKNYFSYIFHIKHDTSYINTQGINYPYGELQLFTDGQFVISNSIKYLSHFYPEISNYSIGILNLIILLSFFPCTLFIYLIFKRLNTGETYRIIAALLITFFSPQIFRIYGHFALSYAYFFPMIWYLLIRHFEAKKKQTKYLLSYLIGLVATIWSFIHPYYVLISTLFLLSYWLFYFIQHTKSYKNINHYFFIFIQAVLPLIIINFILKSIDNHVERPIYPWGIFSNHARFGTVFIPSMPPFSPWFQLIGATRNQIWEGWAYIGITGGIVTIYTLYKLIKKAFINRTFKQFYNPSIPWILKASLPASVLILAYSMGFPFNSGLSFLLEWVPVLNQFRSLGRFAWIFFYVFSVYAFYEVYVIYRLLKIKKSIKFAYFILITALFLYVIEQIPYHRKTKNISSVNVFNYNQLSEDYKEIINAINPKKYQAMIPLPYYVIGNENFVKAPTDKSLKLSETLIYHWALPQFGIAASRSSILEGKKALQLISYPTTDKIIRKNLKSSLPILLVWTKEPLSLHEELLLTKSKKIVENNEAAIYEISFSDLFYNTSKQEIKSFIAQKDSLIRVNSFYLKNRNDLLYSNSFDNVRSSHVYCGNGAKSGFIKSETSLSTKIKVNVNKPTDYILSFWYYHQGERRSDNFCKIVARNYKGEQYDIANKSVSDHYAQIEDEWSLVEIPFMVDPSVQELELFLDGNSYNPMEWFVDELWIRKKGAVVYKIIKPQNILLMNGQKIMLH